MLVGSAIWFIPDMAGSLLLLPMAVAFSVLALAAYGVIDSSFVLLSSLMTRSKPATLALRLQGLVGITVGMLIFTVIYEQVRLEWFLLLAAVQALCTGVAAVAFCFGCAYLVLRFQYVDIMESRTICLFIYGYLLAFGFFQTLTSIRMLYAGHHHLRRIAGRGTERQKPSIDQTGSNRLDVPGKDKLARARV